MKRIIIDTDPGVDDAHALLMAFAHPGVKVEAVCVVAGNVGLERTVANTCTILDIVGTDVPVYRGCNTPLVLPRADAAEHVHGQDGLGDSNYPPSARTIAEEHASAALVRLANETPDELSLVAIGPLTNIAVALKLDPDLPRKIKRLVVMGGAIHSRGNTSNLSTEFNIYSDPEAAFVVFSNWPELTLVSWETTLGHPVSAEVIASWQSLPTASARFFNRISAGVRTFIKEVYNDDRMYAADGLAMAVALEPGIVTEAEIHPISVELNGRFTRGQTTVDWMNRGGQPSNANIVLSVDQLRLEALLTMALG